MGSRKQDLIPKCGICQIWQILLCGKLSSESEGTFYRGPGVCLVRWSNLKKRTIINSGINRRLFSSVQFSHSVVSNSLRPRGLLAAHQASLSIIKSWRLLKLSRSEGSNKPCVHQDPETPQRLRQNCVWVFPVEVRVSSGLPQGQGLWVQQKWVWHKPLGGGHD